MKQGSARKMVRREEYSPFPWHIDEFRLNFEIDRKITTVRADIAVRNRHTADSSSTISLHGKGLELVRVKIDGRELGAEEYSVDAHEMVIFSCPPTCLISTEVRIRPRENTALDGLYPSGDFLLTQCEAEGFRKITFFPDRPDVMTRYDVTLVASRAQFPVLLCNGNAVESGEYADGRHWVRWVDPFRKPSYLFALVAGNLEYIEDHFITRSGRRVTLRVYVEMKNIDQCDHAMASLVRSMKWDEDRFGLEYDLDIYNIVATDDFNMGAMENKSLNIFNSKFVLGKPETATDSDFQAIEAVIGHEYFHNWTGNRVTCRDWFQLTLKEGLTVFRDQEFTSDMQSRAVKRIHDVRDLRSRQFPEDDGPMSHPIRPDAYCEINNFYTMTVYQKGATIIRMFHTLLGEAGFQKGMKLYFQRHDGQAVTCDDFLAAMADANGVNLDEFGKWYGQSGTPEITVETEYNASAKQLTLHLRQKTPPTHDQPLKQPLLIPFAMGLLSEAGEQIPLRVAGDDTAVMFTRVLLLKDEHQSFVFENIAGKPIPSLLRNFSAPVKLVYDYTAGELATLMKHDPDPFVRWEAAQLLAQREIMRNRRRLEKGEGMQLGTELTSAFEALLGDRSSDQALVAEAIMLPDEDYLADQMQVIDVDGIHTSRRFVKSALASHFSSQLEALYRALNHGRAYELSAPAIAGRSLKNVCLSYLVELETGVSLALQQLASSDNMTDTLAALGCLVRSGCAQAETELEMFAKKWQHDALVMDKWFALHATWPGPKTVERVTGLLDHPAFSITNPNKVRALIGAFAMSNPTGFHVASGAGYRFVADRVIELQRINPQVAARIASAFNHWRRYDPMRSRLMQAELQRIAATPELSPDVAEILHNALN
jgi:aminopeptidase N